MERPVTPGEVSASLGLPPRDLSKTPPKTRARWAKSIVSAPDERERLIYLEVTGGEMTVRQVAKKWAIEPEAVRMIAAKVNEWTISNWQGDIAPLRAQQDMQIQEIFSKANLAFEKSKRSKRTRKSSGSSSGDEGSSSFDKVETIEGDGVGDPRFLNVCLSALEQRAKLHGLDAPKKTAFTNASGDGPAELNINLETASDADLLKARRALRALSSSGGEVVDAEFEVKESQDVDGTGLGTREDAVRDGSEGSADAAVSDGDSVLVGDDGGELAE